MCRRFHGIRKMTDLTKCKFSGLQLCKLVGISHHQFQSFKLAGLIEYKTRYNLQEVIYVAITNNFRIKKMSWLTIKKLYSDVFKDLDFLKNINYLKFDIISIDVSNNFYQLMPKHDVVNIDYRMGELNLLYSKDTGNYFYLIYVNKVIEQIIKNSKELDLKIDVENILLSA